MDPQLLIILFLLFSVISSLINKLQERRQKQPDESKLKRKQHPSQRTRPNDPFEEADVEWTEWDIFTEARKPEPKPLPTPPEFQPVQGKRPVSESHIGPEFREIRGTNPVEEPRTGREFREVEGKRPVSDQSSYVEGKTPISRASIRQRTPHLKSRKQQRKQRRLNLTFTPNSVRKAIVYREILGPPRADNMPF